MAGVARPPVVASPAAPVAVFRNALRSIYLPFRALCYRNSCKFRARRRPEHNVPHLQVPGRLAGVSHIGRPNGPGRRPHRKHRIPHRNEWTRPHFALNPLGPTHSPPSPPPPPSPHTPPPSP